MQNLNVSVIIPSRNSSQLLAATLTSVLNQVPLPYEVILVLDSTTDHCIPSGFLQSSVIHIIYDDGLGVYHAMNTGLFFATGDYVYFLGAGDRFLCDTSLQSCISRLGSYSWQSIPDIAIFNVIMHNNHIFPATRLSSKDIQAGFMPCHQGVLFKLRLAKCLGGFNLRFRIAADFDLILRAVCRGCTLQHYQYPLASYLGGGVSTNGSLHEIFMSLLYSKNSFSAFRFLFIESLAMLYRKFFK